MKLLSFTALFLTLSTAVSAVPLSEDATELMSRNTNEDAKNKALDDLLGECQARGPGTVAEVLQAMIAIEKSLDLNDHDDTCVWRRDGELTTHNLAKRDYMSCVRDLFSLLKLLARGLVSNTISTAILRCE